MKTLQKNIHNIILDDKIASSRYSSEPYCDRYNKALEGLEEQKFFIIGAEPGSGKSLGLYQYVRQYLDRGRMPADTGIVIFVSTRGCYGLERFADSSKVG